MDYERERDLQLELDIKLYGVWVARVWSRGDCRSGFCEKHPLESPFPQAAAAKGPLPAVVCGPAVTGSPAHGHCLTAGFVPEDQCWNILDLGVTSVLKYLQVMGLFWICPALFRFHVNVALFMYRVGSTGNFWLKLFFPFWLPSWL